jgi:flagellar assembly factor FliW
MSESDGQKVIVKTSRFGDFEVDTRSLITLPSGIIGFPDFTKFVMFDHKPPFSWFHSTEDSSLAFVVVDGYEFAPQFELKPPIGDRDIDLEKDDEYAVLVIVTVPGDPKRTTANLKAPIFVNLKNRLGVQVIYDDPRLQLKYPLWSEDDLKEGKESTQDKK